MLLGRFYKTWIEIEPRKQQRRFRIATTWYINEQLQSVVFDSSDIQNMENIHKMMSVKSCEREQIESE